MNRLLLLFLFPLAMMPQLRSTGEEPIEDVSDLLKPLIEKSKLPSLSVAVVKDGRTVALGATGVREFGGSQSVTIDDQYHLGSCTKPLTATLAAVLVEKKILDWDTTIGDVLGRKMEIHPQYEEVTLEQLLAHTGGAPGTPPPLAWREAWNDQGKLKPTEQRQEFVEKILGKKPAYQPGEKTIYSNQGYAIAGVMLETLARKSWEDLVVSEIYKPLGMESAGFREPKGRNQPRGHSKTKPVQPGIKADNPDAIAPAGVAHMTVADWAKFARFHLSRDTESGVLENRSSFDKLHSTLPNSGAHGVGGWLVHDLDWAGGHCLQMTGSNTMWFSLLWIFPEKGLACLVATNSGQKNAFKTCDQAVAMLLGRFDTR